MGWRVGSALLLAALLAGCSDMPEFSRPPAFTPPPEFEGFKGFSGRSPAGTNDYAMATPEATSAQRSLVADPSFRLTELRVGMTKAQLEAMYPGRLAFDSGDGRNDLYFVEPQTATPNSAVARDRLSLWLNEGRLATFGLVSTNEPVVVASAPTMPAAGLPGLPPPPSRSAPPRGKYAVQIAAPSTESEARSVIESMRAKYPMLLGREWATISRVSMPNGTFYRVVIGPLGSQAQAGQLCNSLRAQGAECFLRGT
jgi:hypothetical protein